MSDEEIEAIRKAKEGILQATVGPGSDN